MKCIESDYCDAYIEKLKNTLPEMATTSDLIDAGIFRTAQSASRARKTHNSPPYFKMNEKVVLYPKDGVIKYLMDKRAT